MNERLDPVLRAVATTRTDLTSIGSGCESLDPSPAPAVIYCHAGAFVLGNLDTDHRQCVELARLGRADAKAQN